MISGLGVCLSELVQVPTAIIPTSASGLTKPTVIDVHKALSWWDILLMTLGGAFIIIMILWFWRRRAKMRRALRTQNFAREKNLDNPQNWRWKLIQFGERLFGHRKKNLQSELPMASDLDPLHSPRIRPLEHDINLNNMASTKSRARNPSRKKRETMSDVIPQRSSPSQHRHTPFDSYIERRRKEEHDSRLKARTEQDSQDLPSGSQRRTPERREKDVNMGTSSPALAQNPPVTTAQVAQTGSQSYLTSQQGYMMATRPTVTGLSSQSQSPFPIPTYTIAPSFAGPTSTGSVPQQHPGGNLMPMPLALSGNGQGSYWLTQGNVPQPVMVMQPMHTSVSDNPFRRRY